MKLYIQQFINNPSHEYVSIIERHRQLQVEHTHDYFEWFLVNSGSAYHCVNGTTQLLNKGVMVFIRPDDSHAYSNMSPDFKIFNIIVSPQIIMSLFEYLGQGYDPNSFLSVPLPPKTKLSESEFSCIVHELEQLVLSKRILKNRSETYFKIVLMDIFTTCFPIKPVGQYAKIPDWLRWLILEMMKKENFLEGLPAMKRLSNKSYEHLSRSCKKYLSKTPTQLINELRIDYSIKEITTSNNNITEICLDSGFESLSHYYHLFKKQYGMTPLEFRTKVENREISIYDSKFDPNYVRKNIPEGIDFEKPRCCD